MRPQLPDAILAEKVIPVARGLRADNALDLGSALRDGGINTIEVTVEDAGGFAAIEALVGHRMTVGAGTVTSIRQGEAALAAGAQFLVSPHSDRGLIEWSVESGVLMIPGGFTPTELAEAWSHQVPAVKVFPALLGGPGFIRSLLGPYPDLLLIPTGGIDGTNAAAYVSAGAVAVGVGGWLTGLGDLVEVSERAARLRREVV